MAQARVDAIRFEEGGEVLVLSTTSPLAVYHQIPRWAGQDGLRIHELRSSNESLQSVFTSLMSIHRGEG